MPVKILFFIEELSGGGAEKVLCNLVNHMDQSKFDITVQTLWKADAKQFLHPGIHYRYCYARKNRLNEYCSRLAAAAGLTYPLHIKDSYDLEIAYLEFGSTKVLSRSSNKKAKKNRLGPQRSGAEDRRSGGHDPKAVKTIRRF